MGLIYTFSKPGVIPIAAVSEWMHGIGVDVADPVNGKGNRIPLGFAGVAQDIAVAWQGWDPAFSAMLEVVRTHLGVDSVVNTILPAQFAGASGFAIPLVPAAVAFVPGDSLVFRFTVFAATIIGEWQATCLLRRVGSTVAVPIPTYARFSLVIPPAPLPIAGLAHGHFLESLASTYNGIATDAPFKTGLLIPAGGTTMSTFSTDVAGANTLNNSLVISASGQTVNLGPVYLATSYPAAGTGFAVTAGPLAVPIQEVLAVRVSCVAAGAGSVTPPIRVTGRLNFP